MNGSCVVCGRDPVRSGSASVTEQVRPVNVCDRCCVCPSCNSKLDESRTRDMQPIYSIGSSRVEYWNTGQGTYAVACPICGWGHSATMQEQYLRVLEDRFACIATRFQLEGGDLVPNCVSCGRRLGAARVGSMEEQYRPIQICNRCMRCPVCEGRLEDDLVGTVSRGTSETDALLRLKSGSFSPSGLEYGVHCLNASCGWHSLATDVVSRLKSLETTIRLGNKVQVNTSPPQANRRVTEARKAVESRLVEANNRVAMAVLEQSEITAVPTELAVELVACVKCGESIPAGHPFYASDQVAKACGRCFACPYCETPLKENAESINKYVAYCESCGWNVATLPALEATLAQLGGRSPNVPHLDPRLMPALSGKTAEIMLEFAGKRGAPMPRRWLNQMSKLEVDDDD